MKTILKTVIALSLIALAACKNSGGDSPVMAVEGLGQKPEAVINQPLQGQINGVSWVSTKALGVIQPDGKLQVAVSGNGELISCNNTLPKNAGVLFSVPMTVGEYDFDMLRPDQGYAVTWVYRDTQGYNNVFSDMAHVVIQSVDANHMVAGISVKFLDPSNKGTLNGVMDITICR